MPVIRVEMFKRTVEQKCELVKALSDSFVKTCGGDKEAIKIAIIDCIIWYKKVSGYGRIGIDKSIIIEINIIFKIVPNPGFCFKGYQNIKTTKLTKNVVTPIDRFVWKEIPCASTVQGLTPWFAVINKVSPIANKLNPIIR